MQNAKNRFDATLERCVDLVELFDKVRNDDLLRASVVLAVAALDKFCKDRFLDFFESHYEQKNYGLDLCNDCKSYLENAGVTAAYMLSLYQQRESNLRRCSACCQMFGFWALART